MILAHVEPTHGESLAVLVRLGPLLPLAFVAAWAALARARHADRDASVAIAAALALGAAGTIHLVLAPEHFEESGAAGAFFVATGLVQFALAGLIAGRRGGRGALVALLVVAGILLALYAASRAVSLPGLEREPFDGVGLLTKLLEVVGATLAVAAVAGRPRRLVVDGAAAVAAITLAAAVVARPVFDLGPRPLSLAAAAAGALGTATLLAGTSRAVMLRAVADASLVSLLLRAEGWAPFLLGGALAVVARHIGRRLNVPVLAPLAVAVLAVLALPGTDGRLEILHVSHPGEPWVALVAVLLATGLALAIRPTGGLPAAVAFLAAHLVFQALRLLAGRTSLEAVEVPGASLGLFLVAAVVMADLDVTAGRLRPSVAAGLLAGALDVVLRDQGVPYPALLGVTLGVAVVGVVELVSARARRREPQAQTPPGDARRPPHATRTVERRR
jgi:hypothetical protein